MKPVIKPDTREQGELTSEILLVRIAETSCARIQVPLEQTLEEFLQANTPPSLCKIKSKSDRADTAE
jgi:hypothetical protein